MGLEGGRGHVHRTTGKDIGQQTSRHGDTGSEFLGAEVEPDLVGYLAAEVHPWLCHVFQEPLGAGFTGDRLGEHLEEQPNVRENRGCGENCPLTADQVGGTGRLGCKLLESGALLGFHPLDDRRDEPRSGTEVVEQHAMAGSDGRCEIAKALVEAVGGDAHEHAIEEV